MKAWDRLFVAMVASAALLALALPAAATARAGAHPRHVEFRSPSTRASIYLGERDGYEFGLSLGEPDFAILYVEKFDPETQSGVSTAYGAHFDGSPAGGLVRARFGSVATVAVRFVGDGKVHRRKRRANCEGARPRFEEGHFVGRITLAGEGDYSGFTARRVGGYLSRTFRLRCRVRHAAPGRPVISLPEAVEPRVGFFFGGGGGSLALLQAGVRQGNRWLELRAGHREGAQAGAEVTAGTFEYQGKMPVGRSAAATESPAGTLLTSLPGEHPATATLKPAAPFTGEASYVASSHLAHSWTGDLAVQFPGLFEPLAGPEFFSTLCVVSPLVSRYGCEFLPPDWEPSE